MSKVQEEQMWKLELSNQPKRIGKRKKEENMVNIHFYGELSIIEIFIQEVMGTGVLWYI